jgi:hypothetical protein
MKKHLDCGPLYAYRYQRHENQSYQPHSATNATATVTHQPHSATNALINLIRLPTPSTCDELGLAA